MKSKSITLLMTAVALLLASCTINLPTDSVSDITSNTATGESSYDTSDTSNSTSSDNNTNTSSSDSSSTSEPPSVSERLFINEIRPISLGLASSADADGIATSNRVVVFSAKLLARLDAITTQRNYGNRYKLLFVDSTGYIYVKVDYTTYDKLKNSIGSTYEITGNPSYYAGAAEVTLKSYLAKVAITVDLSTISEDVNSIATIHNHIATLRLNNKGVAFDKLVSFNAKYIAKADSSLLLFTDGDNAIYVHGDSYIGNRFTLNASYRLTVAVTMFNFRPGVEYLAQELIADLGITLDIESAPHLTATDLYQYKYEVDKNASYPSYSSKFTSLYIFEGFANYYYKDGSINIVLEDTYKVNTYSTYQNAANAKAIFVKNEDSVSLFGDYEYSRSPYAAYISDEPIKIEVLFMPYLWNTNKYWQGYFLNETINIVE